MLLGNRGDNLGCAGGSELERPPYLPTTRHMHRTLLMHRVHQLVASTRCINSVHQLGASAWCINSVHQLGTSTQCITRTCLRVEQEHIFSCSTRRHVFLFNKRTSLLVEQEDMSSAALQKGPYQKLCSHLHTTEYQHTLCQQSMIFSAYAQKILITTKHDF